MKFKITQHDKEALCRQAPEFAEIVRQADLSSFECCGNLFLALVQSIVSQQLAIKAADAIFRRVEALLGEVKAERLLAVDFDELRTCGLSERKVEYLRGIAEAKISGAVDFEALAKKSDAEVIAELVKLKGVGVWTAEMLLIFSLGRPDVLSIKDLGIRRGIMMLNHLDDLTEADFEIYRKRYSPYGMLANIVSSMNGQTDRKIQYEYDKLDRLVKVTYADGEVETFAYDSWGKLTAASRGNKKATFKYDYFGRMTEKAEGVLKNTYAYNAHGQRTSRITKNGALTLSETKTYDKFGRLTAIQSNGKNVKYLYDDKNQLAAQVIDGIPVEFSYTRYGQLETKVLGGKLAPISSLKYIYSKDGMIAGRVVDGKFQMYSYDKRGQLLSIADMQGNIAEQYIYDPAGNILSKTIDGKTTSYTYDKANQLVTSAIDGKVTRYAYDAAGRMVKEGDKTYSYGYLDKILAVQENGKQTAAFDYYVNGQIASATHGDKTENFLWDGLALIHRGETSFINEPYVTGGNPILSSKSGVMFNDMLGNTLGTKGESYSPVTMTAFGETSDKSAMFTGKPYIGEIGYAFLFRNYRADQGKWQTSDPLGYPDGWNNLAYVNNGVTRTIDFLGAKVYWCARDLASSPIGNHHFLTFIPDNPNDFSGQTSDMGNGDQGWTNGGQAKNGNLVSTPNETNDVQSIRESRDPQNYPPGVLSDWDAEMHEIPTPAGMTDTQFIQALQRAINEYQNNCPYSLVDENCAAWVNSMLERVGIPKSERERLGEFSGVDWGEEDLIPKRFFE